MNLAAFRCAQADAYNIVFFFQIADWTYSGQTIRFKIQYKIIAFCIKKYASTYCLLVKSARIKGHLTLPSKSAKKPKRYIVRKLGKIYFYRKEFFICLLKLLLEVYRVFWSPNNSGRTEASVFGWNFSILISVLKTFYSLFLYSVSAELLLCPNRDLLKLHNNLNNLIQCNLT